MSGQYLQQDLKTSLKLTASMTQSIKTLQLSAQELDSYIAKELEENPFLIKEEPEEDNKLYDRKITTKHREQSIHYDFIANLESKQNLKEYLLLQISSIIHDLKTRFIANYITDLLDDNGYLYATNLEISDYLKISEDIIEKTIIKLQRLEPAGVYARNLSESLKIQLEDKGIYTDSYAQILSNLELVASNETQKLAKICKLSIEDTLKYIQQIKKLEPKPGRNFSLELVNIKIPDVKIFISSSGSIEVCSNKDSMPVILVNKEYYNEIKTKLQKQEDKNLTSEMAKSAGNLVRAVEMRSKTIILVASAIAKEQEDFFKRGVLYLKPLTLGRIAQITGYNESTISRATSNKYIETPFGVIEMKYFFSSGVKSKYSKEEVSSHKVKELIKTLINDEDKQNPTSDDELAIMLKQFNIIIARRTVAKYRESIKIPTSTKRKIKD